MSIYKINEQAALSFSGGRTSGYMLHRILDAFNGVLPDYLPVTFANTGKEMPETLDFVQECSKYWNIDIIWLECDARIGGEGENKYVYDTIITDYKKAKRHGEPFKKLIQARKYLPNPVARFCTQELKVLRIRDYAQNQLGWIPGEWTNVIGIRGDEPRRAAKQIKAGNLVPLYRDGITKEQVGEFWKNQSFDLNLPNNKGVTDWGNCDLCFLKGLGKKQGIIRDRPDLAEWWMDMEKMNNSTFRNDQPTYEQMLMQPSLDIGYDETIPCFCGD